MLASATVDYSHVNFSKQNLRLKTEAVNQLMTEAVNQLMTEAVNQLMTEAVNQLMKPQRWRQVAPDLASKLHVTD